MEYETNIIKDYYFPGIRTRQRREKVSFYASDCLTRPLRRRAGVALTRRPRHWAVLGGMRNHPHRSLARTQRALDGGLLAGLILIK